MTELYPADDQLNALSGAADPQQGVRYPAIGESPYYTSFYKTLYRLLDVARRAGDFRVYKDGELSFGVKGGKLPDGDQIREVAEVTAQPLTDNALNYIYLTVDSGTPEVHADTGGFPAASEQPHLPLATIATGTASAEGVSGSYAHEDITDWRGAGIYRRHGERPRPQLVVAAADAPAAIRATADFVCDGTDDQEQINAALAALPSPGTVGVVHGATGSPDYADVTGGNRGGCVELSDGSFKLSAPVDLSGLSQVTLTGQGASTVLYNEDTSGTAPAILAVNSDTDVQHYLEITGLMVHGTSNSGHGIDLHGVERSVIRDCWIVGNGGDGIHWTVDADEADGQDNKRLTGCEIYRNYGWGIYLSHTHDLFVTDCQLEENWEGGIRADHCKEIYLGQCQIEDSTQIGEPDGSGGFTTNPDSLGLHVTNQIHQMSITGCHFEDEIDIRSDSTVRFSDVSTNAPVTVDSTDGFTDGRVFMAACELTPVSGRVNLLNKAEVYVSGSRL
ncbi:MAG: right-handed parallel beta-helix repeat-containing protein, partial [Planctomycetota bacterium]